MNNHKTFCCTFLLIFLISRLSVMLNKVMVHLVQTMVVTLGGSEWKKFKTQKQSKMHNLITAHSCEIHFFRFDTFDTLFAIQCKFEKEMNGEWMKWTFDSIEVSWNIEYFAKLMGYLCVFIKSITSNMMDFHLTLIFFFIHWEISLKEMIDSEFEKNNQTFPNFAIYFHSRMNSKKY